MRRNLIMIFQYGLFEVNPIVYVITRLPTPKTLTGYTNHESVLDTGPHQPESIDFRTRVFKIINRLNILSKKDKAWKVEALIEGSKKYFVAVKNALERRDETRLKLLMHSELFSQWLVASKAGSHVLASGKCRLERVDIVDFLDRPGEEFDRFTVRLESTRVLSSVSIPGSAMSLSQKNVEYWTFARERRMWRLYKIDSEESFVSRAG